MLDYADPLDRVYSALADPSRRAMLERLAVGPASVSQLGEPLQMTLAAVVQHVQALEASGLIATAKTGRVRTCTLNADALNSAEQWLTERRAVWEQRLDRLGQVLDEQQAAAKPPAATAKTAIRKGRS
jgi:DNA-binding transcriptional ArsR family regulator